MGQGQSGEMGQETQHIPQLSSEPQQDVGLPESKSTVHIDDFDLLKVIGKGSYGKVFQVRKKDQQTIYAMKVLRKDAVIKRNQVQHTKSERKILQDVQHPFIVRLHYAFQSQDKLYLVLSYLPGGELFFHLKREGRFSEERVRLYAAEITLALETLHLLDIVYRDLKPENILLDAEGHICLTDFGLSKEAITTENSTHTFCGTPEYLAPEILKGTGHGKAVDWWSLGTLMYEMMCGLPPYYSKNLNVMYERILKAELRFPAFLSEPAKSLLSGFLMRDPNKRLGSAGPAATDVKAHAFFAMLDWEKVLKKEYTPPFKPQLAEQPEVDTSQFDPIFTSQIPIRSPDEHGQAFVNKHFDNFTYTEESFISRYGHLDGTADGTEDDDDKQGHHVGSVGSDVSLGTSYPNDSALVGSPMVLGSLEEHSIHWVSPHINLQPTNAHGASPFNPSGMQPPIQRPMQPPMHAPVQPSIPMGAGMPAHVPIFAPSMPAPAQPQPVCVGMPIAMNPGPNIATMAPQHTDFMTHPMQQQDSMDNNTAGEMEMES